MSRPPVFGIAGGFGVVQYRETILNLRSLKHAAREGFAVISRMITSDIPAHTAAAAVMKIYAGRAVPYRNIPPVGISVGSASLDATSN